MKLIAPLDVTDALLTDSNVPEDDAPQWLIGSTYAQDDKVILHSTHKIYQSVSDANEGNRPEIDDGTNWIEMGPTNRWAAFDNKVSSKTEQLDRIIYEFTAERLISGIGLIDVGAAVVEVDVLDAAGTELQTFRLERFGQTSIVDYWTFFTTDISMEDIPDVVFDEVDGYPGNTVRLTLIAENSDSMVSIGEVIVGAKHDIGISVTGTSVGIRDFSSKQRDKFGNPIIVERAFASTTVFQFALPTNKVRAVRDILAAQRARPSLYYISANSLSLGAQVYGFFQDFEIPLETSGTSYGSLKVEGLI